MQIGLLSSGYFARWKYQAGTIVTVRTDGFPAIMRKKSSSLFHSVCGIRNSILITLVDRFDSLLL